MQKLEAIGQLTGGIAHDFNNLLMVIINGLQLLAQSGDVQVRASALRPHPGSLLARIRTNTPAAGLCAPATAPSRTRRSAATCRSPARTARSGRAGGYSSSLHVAVDVWPLEADIAALELALLNLAVNARDAMPDGGNLILSARNVPMPIGHPVDWTCARRLCAHQPEDNGTGMAPEIMETGL